MIFPRRGSNREFTGVQILTGKVAEKLKTDIKKRASGEVKPLKAIVYWGFPCIKDSVYVDDGWSGTNFERPSFQRMMEDVNAGRINCIITKDLSRFGREHVMMDYYLEFVFPENHVRYIAVAENEDTEKGLSDFVPFKNLFNDNLT